MRLKLKLGSGGRINDISPGVANGLSLFNVSFDISLTNVRATGSVLELIFVRLLMSVHMSQSVCPHLCSTRSFLFSFILG